MATATSRGLTLTIGVFSTPQLYWRRSIVRETWGAHHEDDASVQFVLCAATRSTRAALAAEDKAHRDMIQLHGCLDATRRGHSRRWSRVQKAFLFLRQCIHGQKSEYIATADDDSYIVVSRVLADCRAFASRGLHGIVYGKIEWFSYERNTGTPTAFGANPLAAAFEWRKHSNVWETLWPGPLGERMRANGSALEALDNRSRWGRGLTLPFPFQKGPLMLFSLAVARMLAESDHSRGEQEHARTVAARKRVVLHDVFIGHVLSSARNGRGVPGPLALVEIGPGGFEELRTLQGGMVKRVATIMSGRAGGHRDDGGCPDVLLPGGRPLRRSLRVVHLNAKHISYIAARTNRSAASALASCAGALHTALRHKDSKQRTRPRAACTTAQWWRATGGVVYTGWDWQWCELRDDA